MEHNNNGYHGIEMWKAQSVLDAYGPNPLPCTDSDYIWHVTIHNDPKTTARTSGSCPLPPMSHGRHKQTPTPIIVSMFLRR